MSLVFAILILSAGMAGAILTSKLTIGGAIIGGVIGFVIYCGVGWAGIVFMSSFFLLGTAATSWKKSVKEKLNIAQENKGRRNAGQVVANGGAGGLLGLAAILFPQHSHLFITMLAAAFSSATADTLSSELGSIYGKRFYNIIGFKKARRGKDGVVSMEGTLFGIAGSILIAAIYAAYFGWHPFFLWIVLAGTIGNITDSILGATLETKGMLQNNAVNFLNTAVAAMFMVVVAC